MNTLSWYYLGLVIFTVICLLMNGYCQMVAHRKTKNDKNSYLLSSVFAYERTYRFLFYLGYLLGLIACAPIVFQYMGMK